MYTFPSRNKQRNLQILPGAFTLMLEGMVEGAIGKKPSRQDLEDALEHALLQFDSSVESLSLEDFRLEYVGLLSVNELEQFDDIGSWLDLSPGDEHDFSGFRGKNWQQRALEWKKTGIPPIVIVVTNEGTVIGDGRGRINFANMMGMKVPTWKLVEINLQEANAIGAGGVGEYMGGGVLWSKEERGKVKTASPELHEEVVELVPEKMVSGTLPRVLRKDSPSMVKLLGLDKVGDDGVYVQEDDPNRDRTISMLKGNEDFQPEEIEPDPITGMPKPV